MNFSDWSPFQILILQMEREGLVNRTFRRLDASRQQAIVLAVLSEAAEKGPGSINIKEIARRAGVSIGSLYMYFPNRDGLLDFVIELCVRYMVSEFDQYRAYLVSLPLNQGLLAYLTGGVEWSHTQVSMVQFFARAAYHGNTELAERVVTPIATSMRTIVRDMLTAAVERGEVRPDIDLEAASRLVHALTIVVGDSQLLPDLNHYFQITDPDMPIERILEAMIVLFQNGLGLHQEILQP